MTVPLEDLVQVYRFEMVLLFVKHLYGDRYRGPLRGSRLAGEVSWKRGFFRPPFWFISPGTLIPHRTLWDDWGGTTDERSCSGRLEVTRQVPGVSVVGVPRRRPQTGACEGPVPRPRRRDLGTSDLSVHTETFPLFSPKEG